jgi:hypothetical protein
MLPSIFANMPLADRCASASADERENENARLIGFLPGEYRTTLYVIVICCLLAVLAGRNKEPTRKKGNH